MDERKRVSLLATSILYARRVAKYDESYQDLEAVVAAAISEGSYEFGLRGRRLVDSLLDLAETRFKDAQTASLSPDSRFILAYGGLHLTGCAMLCERGVNPKRKNHLYILTNMLTTLDIGDVMVGKHSSMVDVFCLIRDMRHTANYQGLDVPVLYVESLIEGGFLLLAMAKAKIAELRSDK